MNNLFFTCGLVTAMLFSSSLFSQSWPDDESSKIASFYNFTKELSNVIDARDSQGLLRLVHDSIRLDEMDEDVPRAHFLKQCIESSNSEVYWNQYSIYALLHQVNHRL